MSQTVNASVKMPARNASEDISKLRTAYEKSLTQNTELAVSLQKARAQIAILKKQNGMKASEVISEDSDVAALKAERDKLQGELQLRFEEIATLTRMLENFQVRGGQVGAFPHALTILEEVTTYSHALEQSHQGLLRSTSWRLTAPLRAIVSFLKGRKAVPVFQYQLTDIVARHQLPAPK